MLMNPSQLTAMSNYGLKFPHHPRVRRRLSLGLLLGIWFGLVSFRPAAGLRPLREIGRVWGAERLFAGKDDNEVGSNTEWNITGTYRGAWRFLDTTNNSSRFSDFRNSYGNSVIDLVSSPTKVKGIHYVQGVIIFHDAYENERTVTGAQIRVEGVYIWPFRQLRIVSISWKEAEVFHEDDYILPSPYHLLGVFLSQVFQETPRDNIWRRKNSAEIYDAEQHCNIEFSGQISRASSSRNGFSSIMYLRHLLSTPLGQCALQMENVVVII
ncbi:hypothetical protein SAY87_008147 [Trapa incisa]|uniref:Uncharacterized protein n=1 Tax=Trapa incisa TaxID=236973 RepID=A0AAN7QJ23_9MYRT|nr:hypothetical protein SAY87_008147 [Trapa incisa]